MGIYDSGFGIDLRPENKKKIVMAIAGAIAVVVFFFIVSSIEIELESSVISHRFEKNPIKPGEQTKLFVGITNSTEIDAENIALRVEAKEKTEFDIIPLNEKFNGSITLISAGNSREITFLINPIGEVLPGTYTLVITTSINGALEEKEITLAVQN